MTPAPSDLTQLCKKSVQEFKLHKKDSIMCKKAVKKYEHTLHPKIKQQEHNQFGHVIAESRMEFEAYLKCEKEIKNLQKTSNLRKKNFDGNLVLF